MLEQYGKSRKCVKGRNSFTGFALKLTKQRYDLLNDHEIFCPKQSYDQCNISLLQFRSTLPCNIPLSLVQKHKQRQT